MDPSVEQIGEVAMNHRQKQLKTESSLFENILTHSQGWNHITLGKILPSSIWQLTSQLSKCGVCIVPYVSKRDMNQFHKASTRRYSVKTSIYLSSSRKRINAHSVCNTTDAMNLVLVNEYQEHQERKVQAREEKEKDKKMAKENEKYYVATFDLQAVLTTPCSLVSELYYSRKLCCYNLTFYSLRDKHVTCHLWDETHGKRGSCEVATCLMKQTQSVCSSAPIEHATYFSDTCGGQNRNKYDAASFIYVISKCPRLKTLNQKFLQSGHSQMECDSVHATIEIAKKKTSIHVPSMWSTLIVNARKKNPYVTVPLKYDHIIDFKSFVQKQSLNFQTAVTGERINWLLVRWLQVRQDAPKRLFINYTFDDTKFLEVVTQHTGLRKKGRPVKWPETDADLDMSYSSKLPATAKKKEDLTNLCVKNIIPEEFHGYFNGLKTSKSAKDLIPVSTSDEDSDFE